MKDVPRPIHLRVQELPHVEKQDGNVERARLATSQQIRWIEQARDKEVLSEQRGAD